MVCSTIYEWTLWLNNTSGWWVFTLKGFKLRKLVVLLYPWKMAKLPKRRGNMICIISNTRSMESSLINAPFRLCSVMLGSTDWSCLLVGTLKFTTGVHSPVPEWMLSWSINDDGQGRWLIHQSNWNVRVWIMHLPRGHHVKEICKNARSPGCFLEYYSFVVYFKSAEFFQ